MLSRFKNNKNIFIIFNFLAISMSIMASDMLLPALPDIGEALVVGESITQIIVSPFFIGSLVGALVFGFLADSCFGRHFSMYLALILFFIGSLLPSFFIETSSISFSRLIQGSGVGAINLLCWANINDFFDGKSAARVMSFLGGLLSVTIVISPLLGGFLSYYYGWRSIFIFFISFSFLNIVYYRLVFDKKFIEGKVHYREERLFQMVLRLLRLRQFIAYASLHPLFCFGELVSLICLPFILEEIFNFSPRYLGIITSSVMLSYVLSSLLSVRLIKKNSLDSIILAGIFVCLLASFGGSICMIFYQTSYCLFISTVLFLSGGALVFGPSSSIALQEASESRGIATMIRSIMILFASFVSSMTPALFASHYKICLFVSLIVSSVFMWFVYVRYCIRVLREGESDFNLKT